MGKPSPGTRQRLVSNCGQCTRLKSAGMLFDSATRHHLWGAHKGAIDPCKIDAPRAVLGHSTILRLSPRTIGYLGSTPRTPTLRGSCSHGNMREHPKFTYVQSVQCHLLRSTHRVCGIAVNDRERGSIPWNGADGIRCIRILASSPDSQSGERGAEPLCSSKYAHVAPLPTKQDKGNWTENRCSNHLVCSSFDVL